MTDTNPPFFSIIIPTYNAQDYFIRCVESCVNQSFGDIEILIIDDCGIDCSIPIIQYYARLDKRIKIVRNFYNLGLFHTRLQGFRLARGEYCLSVDADDFLDLNICKKLAKILQEDISIDMLHFAFKKTPSFFYDLHSLHTPHVGYLYQKDIKSFLNLSNTFHSIWGKAIKTHILKSIAQEISFITPPLNSLEDGIFNLLLSLKIKTYYGLSDVGYFYQRNPSSITHSISHSSFKKKCSDFEKVLHALNILKERYKDDKKLITKYRQKVLSVFFLEARFFNYFSLVRVVKITKSKQICPKYILQNLPVFWTSCIISMKLFFRWQTLVRVLINIFTFGKIKL